MSEKKTVVPSGGNTKGKTVVPKVPVVQPKSITAGLTPVAKLRPAAPPKGK